MLTGDVKLHTEKMSAFLHAQTRPRRTLLQKSMVTLGGNVPLAMGDE